MKYNIIKLFLYLLILYDNIIREDNTWKSMKFIREIGMPMYQTDRYWGQLKINRNSHQMKLLGIYLPLLFCI